MLETSGIFVVLEMASGDFHCAGYFFGGIFTMLETSSGIFTMLETSSVDFFGGIFTVLETSLEGFSWCSRLLLEIFMVLETS